jgi:CRISP-associated protein Cas1
MTTPSMEREPLVVTPVTATELPEMVPARMLNEFAYCPRLFFLEWVDSLWASNADVAEGERRHRRADGGGGAVPLPAEGAVTEARSVELASERLGITAKLDLLEGEGGAVVPVDLKKGRPAPGGTAWEADAVQVCAQILLLREHGYACDRGEIFYAQTRQRVTVDPTPDSSPARCRSSARLGRRRPGWHRRRR